MFSIHSQTGNVNQKSLRFLLIPAKITITKETMTKNVGQDMEKKEPSYTVGEKVN
jgi:hypothetical protein